MSEPRPIKRIDLAAEQDRSDRRMDAQSQETGGVHPAPALASYRFKSGGDNHIVARFYDGVTEGTDERIALPLHLQKQLVGSGYTYTNFQSRTHDELGHQETIQPPYADNGLLLAQPITGTTGVTLTGPDEDLRKIETHPPRQWRKTC